MIAYVDTSALLKLLLEEDGSAVAEAVWDLADARVAAGLAVVEARAALAAAERGRRISAADHAAVKVGLLGLADELHLVDVTGELLGDAAQLAEDQALRGYDAVHLAAALLAGSQVLLSADAGLCAAAERCGLHVADPLAA